MCSGFLSFVSPTPPAWFTLGWVQSCLCSFHSFSSCHSPLPPAPDSPLFCTSSSLTCAPQSPVRIISSVRDSLSSLLKYKSQDGPAWLPKIMSDHTPHRAKMCYRSPHHRSRNCSCFGGPFWPDTATNCMTTATWVACSDWTIAPGDLSSAQRNVVTRLEHLALEHLALGNVSAPPIRVICWNDESSCRNREEQGSQTKVQTRLCLQLDVKVHDPWKLKTRKGKCEKKKKRCRQN